MTMRALLVLPLVLAVLAGCADEEPPGPPRWRLTATFAEDADQEDAEDLERRVAPWEAQVAVQESHPMQAQITLEDGPACSEVREMLQQRPYLDQVGRCTVV